MYLYTEPEKYTFFADSDLSLEFYCVFNEGNLTFSHCIQYLMYRKAKLFNDSKAVDLILHHGFAYEYLSGRLIKNYDYKLWGDAVIEQIVYDANYLKFSQNIDLLNVLLNTEHLLVNACEDKMFGIGLNINYNSKVHKTCWKSSNLLGKVLTRLREDFKNKIFNKEKS